jgi:hypothetical protein
MASDKQPPKPADWHQRPRESRYANVLYAGHADEQTREQMVRLAANERKQAPATPRLLSHAERGPVSPLDGRAR